MNEQMVDWIIKKREGKSLTPEEIQQIVLGYTGGEIPDYQMAALLMAIFFKGLSQREIVSLTRAMIETGDTIDLSGIKGIKVDKHSTGGVGDKTTLIVGPLVAACGIPVAKMSGRGLGFTGGTIDKLESIPGFQTRKTKEAFQDLVNEKGISVIGQSDQVAKADKMIYALRDVTGTVENLGLIASSIMSKKIASGGDKILLDVKCGRGAFMETLDRACRLGEIMVDLGTEAGKETMAIVTRMEEPLGYYVGNSLEVIDAIETLKGNGAVDITRLSLSLAGAMIYLGEKATTPQEGEEMAEEQWENQRGLEVFRRFIQGQGGDEKIVDDYDLLPRATYEQVVYAPQSGYVHEIDGLSLGLLSKKLGAGRETKEDTISFGAGIKLEKKTGDYVEKGSPLAVFYSDDEDKIKASIPEGAHAFILKEKPAQKREIILKTIQG